MFPWRFELSYSVCLKGWQGPASTIKLRPTSGHPTLHMFSSEKVCEKRPRVLQARAFFPSIAQRETSRFSLFIKKTLVTGSCFDNPSYHTTMDLCLVIRILALVCMSCCLGWWENRLHFTDPFLSQTQISGMEPNYWLTRTGASRAIMSDDALDIYKVLKERKLDEPLVFYIAWCRRSSHLERGFHCLRVIQVNGKSSAVGPMQHNLLGVLQMVRRGLMAIWQWRL